MNAKTVFGIVLSILFCQPFTIQAVQPQWTFLGENGQGSVFYYDAEKIARPCEGVVQVWVKMVPSKHESIYVWLMHLVEQDVIMHTKEVEKTKDIAYSVVLYEIDCNQERIVPTISEDYDAQGKLLSLTATSTAFLKELKNVDTSIHPGTIWADLSNAACLLAQQQQQDGVSKGCKPTK